jgi:cytochrome c peroxidase
LEEVIEFYNAGGGPGRNKSNKINPLLLTEQEKQDLVAFLKTLTDWNFVQNAKLVRNE